MVNKYNLDLSSLPKELRLLLEILKVKEEKNKLVLKREFLKNIDWELFLKLAKHHRVYSLIYSKLKNVEEQIIPGYVINKLKLLFQKNTFLMLHLTGEMQQINKMFTENAVRSLFLKGPSLASDLYGDISLRTSSDLDILVSTDDLIRVDELLINNGYVKDDYILTVLNDWKWRHHHVTYYNPIKNIKVEIHWRLNPGPAKEPSFSELWERKRLSTFRGSPVYLLGNEDLFLFLVSHGARHGWSRLRWLVDIDQMTKKDLDWHKISKLLGKYQYLQVGGQALILAHEFLNTKVTEKMQILMNGSRTKRLAQDAIFYLRNMVNLHTEPVPEEVAKYHKNHLFSLMSSWQKLIFIFSFLYPYPEDAQTLPLPKQIHFLYFPLRPILWAWRKTKKHAMS